MLDRPSISPEPAPAEPAARGPAVEVSVGTRLWHMQRELILATLTHLAGDKRTAARTLGISLKTLYNRLASYGDGGWVRRRPATVSTSASATAESSANIARPARS